MPNFIDLVEKDGTWVKDAFYEGLTIDGAQAIGVLYNNGMKVVFMMEQDIFGMITINFKLSNDKGVTWGDTVQFTLEKFMPYLKNVKNMRNTPLTVKKT